MFKLTFKKHLDIDIYMHILELFAGTGSVGKVARELGHTVISLDKDMDADIKTDILNWNLSLRRLILFGRLRLARNTVSQKQRA